MFIIIWLCLISSPWYTMLKHPEYICLLSVAIINTTPLEIERERETREADIQMIYSTNKDI